MSSLNNSGFLIWGRSSVGRAPALQAGGREFESLRLHSLCKSVRERTLKTSYRKISSKQRKDREVIKEI